MPQEIPEQENRNLLLLEWSTAIFSIFWSVWWAYVADSVLKGPEVQQLRLGGIKFSYTWVALFIAVYTSFFAYFYVRWMWQIRTFHWYIELLPFLRTCYPITVVVAGLLCVALFLFSQVETTGAQFIYGIILTVAWISVTMLILFQSERWD